MLLDPTKEQLDGPPTAINLSNKERVQIELIGNKNQRFPSFRIDKTDASEFVGVVSATDHGVEFDRLVATQANGLVHGTTFHYIEPVPRFPIFKT